MRIWLLALAITALAVPATAGEVTITYEIPPGAADFPLPISGDHYNTSPGTATVRIGNVSSIYALPSPLPAPLYLDSFYAINETATFLHPYGGMRYCSVTACAASIGGGVGSVTAFTYPVLRGALTTVTTAGKVSVISMALTFSVADFTATVLGGGNVSLYFHGGPGWILTATGNETSRTFVPEPNTLPMVAVGLVGLASVAWRTRSRKR